MPEDGADCRPLCKRCDRTADVMVAKRASPQATWYPYCEQHDPDPSEYGHRSTWADKITIQRFDETPPEYAVFGRPGGENSQGRIIHVETPAGNDTLCEHEVSGRQRHNLSVARPDDSVLCGKCVQASTWRENYSDDIVAGYLCELRRILRETGQLRDWADDLIEYPTPDPKTNHGIAEGVLNP